MKIKYDYISILGPTATGKTACAIALAKYCPIEIVSVDSVSVYKGLDIGSAKPSREERKAVVHHLIDISTLDEIYTVGQFVENANCLIEEIKNRGALPVFCGGTMMYMAALKRGYQAPKIDGEITKNIEELIESEGLEYAYRLLKLEDPEMASRLHPNDRQRVSRALAVVRATGQSLSSFWNQSESQWNSMDFLIRVNNRDQHRLRIAERVDTMLDKGLRKECELILEQYGNIQHPALKSIGYREMIEGMLENKPTNNVREKICISTSQFVKRQMTWVNSWNNNNMLAIDLYEDDLKLYDTLQRIVENIRL